MQIAILGHSGFLGTLCSDFFKVNGYTVIIVDRNDIGNPELLYPKLVSSDIIINFVGSNISKRWTTKYKQIIYESRILTTRAVVSCLYSIPNKKIHLIQASAIGIYDDENFHDETSKLFGDSFLSKVVIDWENELNLISNSNIKVSIIRLGIVIDSEGGYLKKLLFVNKFRILPYFGKRINNLCFIDSFDFLNGLKFVIEGKSDGIFNFCTSNSTSNYQIANYLSIFNKTSLLFYVPDFILKVIFGDGYFILKGTPVAIPNRLVELGFQFKYDTIDKSLMSKIARIESN